MTQIDRRGFLQTEQGNPYSPDILSQSVLDTDGTGLPTDLYTILRRINNHLPTDVVQGFPWVAGRFQARSMSAGVRNILTPIATSGEINMISGTGITVPEDGIYIFACLNGGITVANIRNWTEISANGTAIVSNYNFSDANNGTLNQITYYGQLNKGNIIEHSIYPSSASAITVTPIRTFLFIRIA